MRARTVLRRLTASLVSLGETRMVCQAAASDTVYDNHHHLLLAAEWLLRAQQASPNDGYSRMYSLYRRKWDRGYIETTGYIIPTLLEADRHLDGAACRESAMRAAEWLLTVQNSDGSFSDIDGGGSQAFDTGQCLLGFNYLYRTNGEARFREAACRAGDWLVTTQDADGAWRRYAYLGRPHTYYTRVAAALIELETLCGSERHGTAGRANIAWAVSRQQPNSFFPDAEFVLHEPPYLHTIAYVMEGLLMAHGLTKEEEFLEPAWRNAEAFKVINLERELILGSQYTPNYKVVGDSVCVTGVAQWAGICLDLYRLTGNEDYRRLAIRNMFYLKSKQIRNGINTRGGFTASIPYYGPYASGKLVNWNNKFFIDALLKYLPLSVSLEEERAEWQEATGRFRNRAAENIEFSGCPIHRQNPGPHSDRNARHGHPATQE